MPSVLSPAERQLLVEPFKDSISYTKLLAIRSAPGVFGTAVYDVRHFVVGTDTIPAGVADSLRWKDVIFDNAGGGSVATPRFPVLAPLRPGLLSVPAGHGGEDSHGVADLVRPW